MYVPSAKDNEIAELERQVAALLPGCPAIPLAVAQWAHALLAQRPSEPRRMSDDLKDALDRAAETEAQLVDAERARDDLQRRLDEAAAEHARVCGERDKARVQLAAREAELAEKDRAAGFVVFQELADTKTRLYALQNASRDLMGELEESDIEPHGGEHHDDQCPVCVAYARAEAALVASLAETTEPAPQPVEHMQVSREQWSLWLGTDQTFESLNALLRGERPDSLKPPELTVESVRAALKQSAAGANELLEQTRSVFRPPDRDLRMGASSAPQPVEPPGHNAFGHIGTDFFAQQEALSQPVEPKAKRYVFVPRYGCPTEPFLERAAGLEPANPQVSLEALQRQVDRHERALRRFVNYVFSPASGPRHGHLHAMLDADAAGEVKV